MESEAITFWIVVWIVASLAGGLTALGTEKFRRWRTTRRILKAVREQMALDDERHDEFARMMDDLGNRPEHLQVGAPRRATEYRDQYGRVASRPRN